MASWQEAYVWLQYSNSANDPPPFHGLHRFTWSTVQGGLLTALFLIAANFFRSRQKPIHPGHWILLLNSLLIPITLVAHTVLSIQINKFADDAPVWIYTVNDAIYLAFYACITLLWLVIFRRDKQGRHWATAYAFYLALSAITTLSYLSATFTGVAIANSLIFPTQFVILMALAVCVVLDLSNRIFRDWLHWFGLAITLLAFLLNPLVSLLDYVTKIAA